MNKLRISVAVGDYDRTRPLVDGRVQVDGADPVYMLLTPEEMFFRSMRHESFDVCELSFSSYAVRTARGDCPMWRSRSFCRACFATPPSMCARTVSVARKT